MKKPSFRESLALLLWGVLTGVGLWGAEWGVAASVLRGFAAAAPLYVLGAAALGSLLRLSLLRRESRLTFTSILGMLLWLLIFQSRFFPPAARPTFLFVWVFLSSVVLSALVAVDPLFHLLQQVRANPYARTQVKPLTEWAVVTAVLGLAFWFLRSSGVGLFFQFLERHDLAVLILLSLGAAYQRTRLSKPARFGRSLMTACTLHVLLGALLNGFGWAGAAIRLFSVVWGILYFEEFAALFLWAREELRSWTRPEVSLRHPALATVTARFAWAGDAWRSLRISATSGRWKEQGQARWRQVRDRWSAILAQRSKSLSLAALAVLVAGAVYPLWRVYYRWSHVTVLEFTPAGLVKDRVAIRLRFSGAVQPRLGDLRRLDCLTITPPLPGVYRQETPETLIYLPSEPLRPSTPYRVVFSGENLTSRVKSVQRRAVTEFNTDFFRLVNARVFYNVDQITGQDMEVVGELNFNQPVSLDDLRRNTDISKDGKPLSCAWETSLEPTRFYFRSDAVQPGTKEQTIDVRVRRGLACMNGTVPLESDVRQTLRLPATPRPQVTEVKLWHEPGNTLVSLLFNMPISKEQVAAHVSVDPVVPVQVDTEYAYAVLRGPFQPNVRYTVRVSPGLVARNGNVMTAKFEGSVRIEDRPASVSFAREGHILSLSGPQTLAVKTVNLDAVNVRIYKIFRNNLLSFLNNEYGAPFAKLVYNGGYKIDGGEINEDLTQHINLKKFQNEPYKGLFKIELGDPRSYQAQASAWFLCTDLGLVAKQSGDDLWVYAMGIQDLSPAPGTTLELYSDTNQVMDRAVTDASGRAVFSDWRKHAYDFRPHYVVAKKDDDFSFLFFSRTEKNAYQFAIGGDPYDRRGLQAFLTPERGVYRPGETAFLTAVLRNADRSLPADVPVQLVVRDPRGTEFARLDGRPNANGLIRFNVDFSLDALTGSYDLNLMMPGGRETLGYASLKVEEFIPDKLKVDVVSPAGAIAPGKPVTFTVHGRQLFGPPAVGAKVVTRVQFYSRIFSPPAWEGYTFHDDTRRFDDQVVELGEDRLDGQGRKDYDVAVPPLTPPSALKAYVYTEVFDSGGRPVSAAGTADVDVYPHYLGVKVEGSGARRVKDPVYFHAVAVTPDGRPASLAKVRVVIKRKSYYSIFRRSAWGRSDYDSSSYEELIQNEVRDLSKETRWSFLPAQEGDYTILLVSPEGMRTSLVVNVLGSGYDTTNLESPEKLRLLLDKKSYAPGEEAQVLVRSPFAGKLFLTLERERVYESRVIELTGRETTVRFPVREDYLPNMYVVGLVVRTPDEKNATLPMESFGVETLSVDTDGRAIRLDWDTPARTESSPGLDVSLRVTGAPERTNVVLAAVDEGILQITGFETPDPLAFFYRKNGLTTRTFSLMDLILPDLAAKKFAVGGGDAGEFTRRHLNPVVAKKKKSMAVVSGILTPDAEGRVRWHVDTPGFNGELRVMALAVRGDRFGSGARSVQVADPIVLIPSFPRFVAPGDEFQIPVEVYNKTGRDGVIAVSVRVEGPVSLTEKFQNVTLAKDGQKKLFFPAKALADAGVARFVVTAKGNGFESSATEELSIRPAAPLETVVKAGVLSPGQSTALQVPADYIPFGQTLRLNLSSNPMFRYLGALDYLIRYPYGCAEQVTSQAFPLLYLKDLGFATGRFAERANAIDTYVQAAIKTLQKQQLANGEFALWPGGGSGGRWLSYYVAHFLLEAQAQGYDVSPRVMDRIRTMVQEGVIDQPVIVENEDGNDEGDASDEEGGESAEGDGEESSEDGEARAVVPSRLDRRAQADPAALALDPYRLYLRVLLNKPDRESMTVLATAPREKNLSETDRAWLAMAYARLGDAATAQRLLTPDFKSRWLYREQFGDFNSPVRNTALYLAALAAADPSSARVRQIVDYLGGQLDKGWFGNTQENAWALMALSRAFGNAREPAKAEVTVDGAPYRRLEGKDLNVTDNGLSGKTLTLKNDGAGPLYYHLLAEGTPRTPSSRKKAEGLTVERAYFNAKGEAVNPSNVPQGDLVVVTVTVTAEKPLRNLALVDLLPAGFEIENPRLRSRGDLGFEPSYGFAASYQDIRDDRLLLFADAVEGKQSFSYSVRAVTPGRFVIPNAFAEAMYDPAIVAESPSGGVLVVTDNN
jgi:uncharacterized protein YfaS (alpha-2-macroglobulin family)